MIFADTMFGTLTSAVWRHAKGKRRRMALYYLLFALANIALTLQPIALANVLNAAQRGGAGGLGRVAGWVGVYIGLNLLFWSLHGPARVIERRVAFTAYQNYVAMLYRKVTELPLRWHQEHHSGGVINRVNKAGRALSAFGQSDFVILQNVMRFIGSLCVLSWYSWWVGLASVAVAGLIFLCVRFFNRDLVPLVQTTNEREHSLNAALYDYIGNIITVLTLRMQGSTAGEIQRRFLGMKPSYWSETVLNEKKWFAFDSSLVVAQALIVGAYILLHMAAGAAIMVGSIVAIFQYQQTINQAFAQWSMSYEQLLYQHTDFRGVDELLADHARLVGDQGLVEPPPLAWQALAIRNLRFTHQDGVDQLGHLRDVSLTIKAGQKIALIGSSGSGKTTLLTLLRGLYEAQTVELLIDGQRFGALAPLAGFTTLVPQDAEIFENTVYYNLTLGTKVSEELVQQALHVTTFDQIAPGLAQGLQTDMRERGVNLSGGQKQRLALTRGLIAARNSSLLMMDEPTSAVDIATESTIFNRMFAAYGSKAIVASIHRLHLLPRFDTIGLMRDGALVEVGSFDELLARRGAFYNVWQHHLSQSAGHDARQTPR